jgi:hypothetical protein
MVIDSHTGESIAFILYMCVDFRGPYSNQRILIVLTTAQK